MRKLCILLLSIYIFLLGCQPNQKIGKSDKSDNIVLKIKGLHKKEKQEKNRNEKAKIAWDIALLLYKEDAYNEYLTYEYVRIIHKYKETKYATRAFMNLHKGSFNTIIEDLDAKKYQQHLINIKESDEMINGAVQHIQWLKAPEKKTD